MARASNLNSDYRVSVHACGKYRYATTQPGIIDKNGKKVHRHYTWGTLEDNNKFIPGRNYRDASEEERAKLIFPEEWDLSLIGSPPVPDTLPLAVTDVYRERLFGAVWLLDQISDRLHLKEDLLSVFGSENIVKDILTIAMFLYITGLSPDRLARTQRIEKYPSDRILDLSSVTLLSQSITEYHRMEFLKRIAGRKQDDEYLSVDSAAKTAWSDNPVNVRWGPDKEGLPPEPAVEVVVYSLSGHQPVYYTILPGNMPDPGAVNRILSDMEEAGFRNVILITDRGYESVSNLEQYIIAEQKAIMCVKSGSGLALRRIKGFGAFIYVPDGMEIDPKTRLYYAQYKEPYTVILEDGREKTGDIRLNLFFSPAGRSARLTDLDIELVTTREYLDELIKSKTGIPDPEGLQKKYSLFILKFTEMPGRHIAEADGKIKAVPPYTALESYSKDEEAVLLKRITAGFISLLTIGLDLPPLEVLGHYRVRDEQEKYFSQMKAGMLCDCQRNSGEEGKTGRSFIQFAGLMMASYLRRVWKATELHGLFGSPLDLIDEMRSIRLIEYPEQNKTIITPFAGKQRTICDCFGFPIPEGSDTDSRMESDEQAKKKDGRKKGSRSKSEGI